MEMGGGREGGGGEVTRPGSLLGPESLKEREHT